MYDEIEQAIVDFVATYEWAPDSHSHVPRPDCTNFLDNNRACSVNRPCGDCIVGCEESCDEFVLRPRAPTMADDVLYSPFEPARYPPMLYNPPRYNAQDEEGAYRTAVGMYQPGWDSVDLVVSLFLPSQCYKKTGAIRFLKCSLVLTIYSILQN